MMRALVTGAGGFIGSRVVERLCGRGTPVRALVRRGLVEDAPPLCERVRGDVTDADAVARAVEGCSVVYHCAWGGGTLDEGRRINVEGTRNVVRAAAAAGVERVVHVSTMSVHGPRLPAVLTEDAPLVFHGDPYGVTKAEGERAAFELGAALGVEVVALRPTLVYGPAALFWVRSYLDRTRREALALVDGGQGLANLVYVDDVVDAMLCAAERPGVAGEAFLVSGETPVTWREYIGHFARMARKPLPPAVPRRRAWVEMQWLRVYGTLTNRPRRLVGMDLALMTQRTRVSIAKAVGVLGWTPRVALDEGMAHCESWARDEGILPPPTEEGTAPGRVYASIAS